MARVDIKKWLDERFAEHHGQSEGRRVIVWIYPNSVFMDAMIKAVQMA